MTTSIIYQGDLRCEATHVQSGTIINTDAPTDNLGKGEKFSPTDLLCVSLATCMITTMGIRANQMEINLKGTTLAVTKTMASEPRRIAKVEIILSFPQLNLSEKDQTILQKIGDNCPVIKSLNSATEIVTVYKWS